MTYTHIQVVPYSPQWPKFFEDAAKNIQNALGENCITVHHIGSTAVPELAAKPVIDIMPVVRDIQLVDRVNHVLAQLGFEVQGEHGIPFRRFFTKNAETRTHNVHIYETGNPEIERHLMFRDWMRVHAGDRQAYGLLKQKLAQQFPNDIMNYCLGKESFVAHILDKSGWNGIRFVTPITVYEKEFYDALMEDNPPSDLPFVFYKGQKIVAAACVLHTAHNPARLLKIEPGFEGMRYEFEQILEKWIRQTISDSL